MKYALRVMLSKTKTARLGLVLILVHILCLVGSGPRIPNKWFQSYFSTSRCSHS